MGDAGATTRPVPGDFPPGVLVFSDSAALGREAATRFVEHARRFIAGEGSFSVALAGGKTPQGLYRLLAEDPLRPAVDWRKVHLFWGDERLVPPDHPESNYGLARRELISRVPIPPANVHRMEAERPDLGRAAAEYEESLRKHLATGAAGFPRFHLILLGLGADGHTASLFPAPEQSGTTSRWVTTPFVEKLGTRRMTLTLPVLNAAHHVIFLVAGADKAAVLRRVLAPSEGVEAGAGGQLPPPARQVKPHDGDRVFLVDAAAARVLPGSGKKR